MSLIRFIANRIAGLGNALCFLGDILRNILTGRIRYKYFGKVYTANIKTIRKTCFKFIFNNYPSPVKYTRF